MDENLLYSDLLEVLDKATPSTWVYEDYYQSWGRTHNYHYYGQPLRRIKYPRRTRQFNRSAAKTSFPDEVSDKSLTLDTLRRERLNQVRVTFATAITALILGILLVFTGVVDT